MAAGLPDKMYLKIGEVSAYTGLPSSVLRYWESEFPLLKPKKSSSGQRLYTKQDVERIAEIKKLLYAEKLTIEGARRRLESRQKSRELEIPRDNLTAVMREVREELRSLRDALT